MTFISEIKKSTIKFFWKHKIQPIANTILNKKRTPRDITIPDFKLYHRATAIKTALYCHKNRYEDQWNGIENPDMNPTSTPTLFLTNLQKHTL
jgi:hypothetical protein